MDPFECSVAALKHVKFIDIQPVRDSEAQFGHKAVVTFQQSVWLTAAVRTETYYRPVFVQRTATHSQTHLSRRHSPCSPTLWLSSLSALQSLAAAL